ncbi:hypothetical protein ILYODFUR_037834, partial [Ilyodon furcidens]
TELIIPVTSVMEDQLYEHVSHQLCLGVAHFMIKTKSIRDISYILISSNFYSKADLGVGSKPAFLNAGSSFNGSVTRILFLLLRINFILLGQANKNQSTLQKVWKPSFF